MTIATALTPQEVKEGLREQVRAAKQRQRRAERALHAARTAMHDAARTAWTAGATREELAEDMACSPVTVSLVVRSGT